MNISDRTTAAAIITAINNTDAKAPKAILDAYADCQRISTEAQHLYPRGDTLAPAVAAALSEGRDPATDPAVQRILIATQIGGEGIAAQVTDIAYDRFRQVCTQHADDLVLAWRKPFDTAAETLAVAHERIGTLALNDHAAIVALGGDSAGVWATARAAEQTIDTIAAGWMAVGEFTRTVQPSPDFRVLRLAAVDYQTWTAHNLHRAKLTPWEILPLGLELALPTVAEYRQRVQLITDAMAQPATVIDRQRSLVANREIVVDVATGKEVTAA